MDNNTPISTTTSTTSEEVFLVSSPDAGLSPSTADGHKPGRELQSSSLQCCCGSLDCAFLKKNCSVLKSLEKDVHRAGQMGKVGFFAFAFPADHLSRKWPPHIFHSLSLYIAGDMC